MAGSHICTACYYVGDPVKKRKVSYLVLFFLILLGVIPAVIYAFWIMHEDYSVCPKCGSREVIPADSVRGAKLLAEIGRESDQSAQSDTPPGQTSQPVGYDPESASAPPERESGGRISPKAVYATIGLVAVIFAVGALLVSAARNSSALMASQQVPKEESALADTGIWHQIKPLYYHAEGGCEKLDGGYPNSTWGNNQEVTITEHIVDDGKALEVSGKYQDGIVASFRLYKKASDCPAPLAGK